MASYKNLILGCSLGAGTLLILISTQLSNTIISIQNGTNTQKTIEANMAPIADAGKDKKVNEGATVILDGTNSHDQDNGTITSYLWKQTSGIPVVLNESRTPTSTIVAPHVLRDTNFIFELMVKDDRNATSTSTVNVYVKHINHTPIAKNQTILLDEDTPSHIILTATDYNVNDTLNYSILTKPAHGTLSGIAPNLIYKPNRNYSGKDSFTFKIDDGHGISNSNSIGKVSLTIAPANEPPVVINGSSEVSVYQNKPMNITLAGKDPNNDSLSFFLVKKPSLGNTSKIRSLNKTSSMVTYTPNPHSYGQDVLTFKANDGNLNSTNTASVIMKLKPWKLPSHRPVAVDQYLHNKTLQRR